MSKEKVWFHGYGFRECATWACEYCKNYWVCGMDLVVEENKKKHQNECKANPEKQIAELKRKLEDTKRYVQVLSNNADTCQQDSPLSTYYKGQKDVLGQILVWMDWK